ncbi:MAG: hypothetical protein HCA25_06875 [Dolichospermum sp. DET50]|nr:hypothetical protein [Dolichospermum sp. DET66]MBS3032004.1 hypothetical protein [Dolichospermum sp. DET67]MBS3037213.1 hypothetical protein [Dolichospermum sp. DET50]QSX70541.1 MAG: hypothetical protein EZY12_06050 [Dolichospermum sp. DET69]
MEAKNHAETALQILHDIQSPLPNPLLRGEGTGNNDHKASFLVGEGTGDNDHKASLLVGERFGERFLHIPKNEQVYYQFLLAKSYHGLGEISTSIKILETAKTNTQIEYNPQLYIDILNQLNLLYFQQEEYLTAFYTKQERLQIEQQYSFRAFVGASYLNPQRKIIQSVNSDKENTGEIAQEIVASGREEDVKRLRSKIAEDRYRLIVIHGQSGVGKSSILQAGLIPALEQETIKAKQVLPILLRSYNNWLGELAKALNVGTIHELSLRSTDAIIKKLVENSTNNLLTVLIFDQFEEFFFVNQEQTERQAFYDFLRRCLITNDVKIVLSLREDYLHYLLELERKFANEKNTDIVNNTDILSKDIRYYLGNFSPTDATTVFTSLTKRSKYSLQKDLIDKLVAELAGNIGEIRPIELQIVGTQLENQRITTLEKYQEKIHNKEKLVEGFLQDVIQECGQKNQKLAELVLYLLTNENNTRPLKTSAELAEELSLTGFMQNAVGVIHELPLPKNPTYTNEDLDLVLKILVVSGLVLLIQESPENRYQLVHDYLVEFIRQKDNELLQKLVETQKQLQEAEAAKQILADAKIQADKKIHEGQKRLKLSSGLAMSFVVIAAMASVYGMNQLRETKVAQRKQTELRAQTQKLASQTQDSEKKSQAAEKNKQTAEKNFKLAEQNTKKARENLLAAKTKLEAVNKQAETLKQKNTEAELKVKTANDNIKTAETKSQQAKIQQQQAENKAKEARETFKTANAALKKAETAKQAALKAQQEALIVTKLEQGGVNVLRQFQFEELPSLVSAVRNGKTLKTIVKNKALDKYPTISPIYALNNILDNIKERIQFKGHQGDVISVSFSPDGKTIATASSDKTARLWNLQGQLIQEFKGHQGDVISVSFSPDGKTIATASSDKTARLWNLQGQLIQEFKGHQDRVISVSFSPDGKTIATASWDNTARLWNLQGQLIQEFKGHQGYVISVSFSPDGKTIATASDDNTARLWNLQGQLIQEFKGHQGTVNSVSFSPDGKTIATASDDKTARLWNLQGQMIQEFKGHQGTVNSVSFSPDGKTIATASDDKTARLWNLQGQLIQEFKGHQGDVNSVSFSPDGKTIATASDDKTARLWNLQGQLIQEFKGHQGDVNSVSFSPDGKTIATASWDNTARLWNLQGQLIQEFKGHQGDVNSVSFSPDGKTIATASDDKTARLWNLQGQMIQEFKGHQDTVISVSFSPDGKTIATASDDKTARLWNLQGQLIQEFKGHQGTVNSVSFSPDGKTIATASDDKTARLWNLQGQLIQEFKGHQDRVISVSFSPDGKTIATASWDNTARLWNLQGQLIQEFKGHQGTVRSVSFSPDGKTIATASWDNTARLWPVRDLDRAIKDGCAWLKDYLHNPNVDLSEEDKRLCDGV